MKKTVVFLMVSVFILATGCSTKQTFLNDDGKTVIGFISESMTVQRWIRDREIFVGRAEDLGAEVIVQNAYEDSERQIEIGIDMIKKGVDVIVIVPWDKDSLTELVRYAHANNVKVISYDRLINNANVDLYISFDNYQVGYSMAEAAVLNNRFGNYVVLNGPQTDNNCYLIKDGIYDVLNPYIDRGIINVVGETWIEAWRDEAAYEYISKLLSNGTQINAIIAADDRLAEGAINALSENRLAGSVYVTGQDAELAACQRIVEGTQHMTVYKPIRILAEGAAEMAVRMAEGEDLGVIDTISDGSYYVPSIVYAIRPVNKGNMVEEIINDGFFEIEKVYQNVPKSEWPQ